MHQALPVQLRQALLTPPRAQPMPRQPRRPQPVPRPRQPRLLSPTRGRAARTSPFRDSDTKGRALDRETKSRPRPVLLRLPLHCRRRVGPRRRRSQHSCSAALLTQSKPTKCWTPANWRSPTRQLQKIPKTARQALPVQLQHALPAWPAGCSRQGMQVQQHKALPVRLHQALPVAKPCECDCKRLRQSSLWLP